LAITASRLPSGAQAIEARSRGMLSNLTLRSPRITRCSTRPLIADMT